MVDAQVALLKHDGLETTRNIIAADGWIRAAAPTAHQIRLDDDAVHCSVVRVMQRLERFGAMLFLNAHRIIIFQFRSYIAGDKEIAGNMLL